jgi:hypothetical protein
MPETGHSRPSAVGPDANIVAESKLVGPITTGASHGSRSLHVYCSRALEQGQARRPESAVHAEGDLGDPRSSAARRSAPLQALEALWVWAFIFTFLSIGMTTRFRAFVKVRAKPFYAFTAGVAVNVVLGFFLSTQVFVGFWSHFGQ